MSKDKSCSTCAHSHMMLTTRYHVICTEPKSEWYMMDCIEPCDCYVYEPGTEKEETNDGRN
jgi:hypothetical protein